MAQTWISLWRKSLIESNRILEYLYGKNVLKYIFQDDSFYRHIYHYKYLIKNLIMIIKLQREKENWGF